MLMFSQMQITELNQHVAFEQSANFFSCFLIYRVENSEGYQRLCLSLCVSDVGVLF